MQFVAVKSLAQQDIQTANRVRTTELLEPRTVKANQIRALVLEYGLVAPKQLAHLRAAIPHWLEDAVNGLSCQFRQLLDCLRGDPVALDARVAELGEEIDAIAQSDPIYC
jgi:transposase